MAKLPFGGDPSFLAAAKAGLREMRFVTNGKIIMEA
jgi:hypothetical protein